MIAVNQDVLGIQGTVLWQNCKTYADISACQQIWGRPLADGSWAMCAVNYDVLPATITCDGGCFGAMGMLSGAVRDLWAHQDIGNFSTLPIAIGGDGGSRMFRVEVVETLPWNVGH